METRDLDSHLEWVTLREASLWRWLLLLPILGLALLLGPLLQAPLLFAMQESDYADLVLTLANFVGTLLVFAGLAALVLWRPVWMFAFRRLRPEWKLFGAGFGLQFAVTIVFFLIYALAGVFQFEYNKPDFGVLLISIPLALVSLLVQTGTEEFMMRGALTQMAFRIWRNPVFVIAVPGVIFAALHFTNIQHMDGGVILLTPYLVMGLLFGWYAWRTGSIWLSWGMHYANNAFLVLAIGAKGDVHDAITGLSFSFTNPGTWTFIWTDVVTSLATAVVVWLLILRRRPNVGSIARERRAAARATPEVQPA
jgi:CAAX protease family protein